MRTIQLYLLLTLFSLPLSGQQWNILSDDLPMSGRYDDLVFVNDSTGWTVNSSGQIHKTLDGGEQWTLQYDDSYYMRTVDFIDEHIGVAGTLEGVILRTIDGGENWTEIQDEIHEGIEGLCGLSHLGQTFYGVGVYFDPAFFILSTDAGETWEWTDMSDTLDGLVDCLFLNENVGLIAGYRGTDGAVIQKTTDGGETWTEVYTGSGGIEYAWKIFQVDDQLLYASIESFSGVGSYALKTTDGGDTWNVLTVDEVSNVDIQGIGFIDDLHGWAGPRFQHLYETIDGGLTWTISSGPENINRIFKNENGDLYASGSFLYKYSSTVGLPDISVVQDHSISVSPNPSDHWLNISLDMVSNSNLVLGIYSLEGQLVEQVYRGRISKGPAEFNVDIKELAAGTYLLFLRADIGFQSLQFTKE